MPEGGDGETTGVSSVLPLKHQSERYLKLIFYLNTLYVTETQMIFYS